jgi:hypothetical protein
VIVVNGRIGDRALRYRLVRPLVASSAPCGSHAYNPISTPSASPFSESVLPRESASRET